jgi:excisionase family DNA binding protein
MNKIQKPLNVQEAAEFLGLKVSCVYNLIHYKKLTGHRPGGKKLVFKLSDLENYLYRNQVGNNSDRANTILSAAQKRKPHKKAKAGETA